MRHFFMRLCKFDCVEIILSNATNPATDASLSEIAETRSPANQPAPIFPSTAPYLVVHIFLLRLLASLGASVPHFVVKQLPWSRKIPSENPLFAMSPYLLTRTQPEHVVLASTSFGTSWGTALQQGCNFPTSNCIVW